MRRARQGLDVGGEGIGCAKALRQEQGLLSLRLESACLLENAEWAGWVGGSMRQGEERRALNRPTIFLRFNPWGQGGGGSEDSEQGRVRMRAVCYAHETEG